MDKTQDDLPIEDEASEGVAGLSPSRGIWIALGTFVPTFLAIVFGIPYLADLPIASRFPVGLQGSTPPVVSSRASERGVGGAPLQEMPSQLRTIPAVGHADAPAQLLSNSTREALGNAEPAATTPEIPRPALRPTRPQVEGKAAESQRSPSAVTKDDAWVREAGFGYPAKVRREDAPAALWVVWIGKDPRGVNRSERRR